MLIVWISFRIISVVTLKIGRWYEFRILSLNANGTRGHSEVSAPFQLDESKIFSNFLFLNLSAFCLLTVYHSILFCFFFRSIYCGDAEPKHLPAPINFAVDGTEQMINSSVYTKLTWKSANSDYPIEKYEITWSRFIGEGNGSLFMEKALLPEVS